MMRVLGTRIAVKIIEEKQKGSILLVKSVQTQLATVEFASPDSIIKVGSTVIIDKYHGTEVKVKDQTYLILDVEDVLAEIN